MFGLPLLLETSAERSKAGGASPRKTWGGVPTLRSLALLLVVLLAGYGAYNLYQKWDDEGLQSATQAAPPATVVAGGATVPARRESTAATNSTAVGCDGVLEWGAANHKRQEEAGLLLEKFDDSSRVEQIKLSDLIRARNALQDLVVEQRESDPPPAAIRLNDTFVAAFTAAAEILDGMINGDRSTTAGATTELQRLDAQMQSQTEDLALLCDI
jgi:hypothetical protein